MQRKLLGKLGTLAGAAVLTCGVLSSAARTARAEQPAASAPPTAGRAPAADAHTSTDNAASTPVSPSPAAPAAPTAVPAPAPVTPTPASPSETAASPTPPVTPNATNANAAATATNASATATDPSAPRVTPPPAARLATSPGEAIVHVAVSHRDAWLETRSDVDGGAFVRTCRAPCDIKLLVEGVEARVVAPGMTPSNVFRFEAGSGVAGVRVDGGSASARRAGIITLAIGIPVALAGMALFAQGRVKDSSGLQAAGIAGLAAGGVTVAVSLPLLVLGTTHVKNARGSLIAIGEPRPRM